MRQFITLCAFLPLVVLAQETWEVEAGGSTVPGQTPPYYDPNELVIHVGDAVHWIAVSGTHNVYGQLDMFPDNPEGFDSGEPSQDLDYTHTFTIPGDYMYHCTQQGHAATQHGMITVLLNSSVEEIVDIGKLVLFPVPAEGILTIQLRDAGIRQVEIMSVDGRSLLNEYPGNAPTSVVSVGQLAAGRYLLRLTESSGRSVVRPFLKN